jgi:hypothetical protein
MPRTKQTRLIVMVLCAVSAMAAADEFQLMKSEGLGALKIGIPRAAAMKILGSPSKSGKLEQWDADGMFHQQVEFKAAGVTLSLVSKSKGSAQTVGSITAVAPCQLATAGGIRLGSTESEVIKAYRRHYNKEDSTAGSLVVAGSIYGGVTFEITKGKVSQIFIGASAE